MSKFFYNIFFRMALQNKFVFLILFLLSIFINKHAFSENIDVLKGKYISILGGCYSCHTDNSVGIPFAGGRKIATKFGDFYSPNITPHKTQGIGKWSDDDFIKSFKKGISPNGYHYLPVFPYTSFSGMTEKDLLLLKSYLFSLKPADIQNKKHKINFLLKFNILIQVWQKLFFYQKEYEFDSNYSESWNRGKYIVENLAHCGECHTPRNIFGALKKSKNLFGSNSSVIGETSPNITNHNDKGISEWTKEDFKLFMLTGDKPNFDNVQGSMEEVILHSTSKFNDYDIDSIYDYLNTLKIN